MSFLFYLLTDIEIKNSEVHEKPIGISVQRTYTALQTYVLTKKI